MNFEKYFDANRSQKWNTPKLFCKSQVAMTLAIFGTKFESDICEKNHWNRIQTDRNRSLGYTDKLKCVISFKFRYFVPKSVIVSRSRIADFAWTPTHKVAFITLIFFHLQKKIKTKPSFGAFLSQINILRKISERISVVAKVLAICLSQQRVHKYAYRRRLVFEKSSTTPAVVFGDDTHLLRYFA